MNYSLLQAFGETRTCPNSKKRTVLMNFKTCVGFLQDTVIAYTTPITPNSLDAPTIVNTSPNLPTTPTSPTNMYCNSSLPRYLSYHAYYSNLSWA